MLVLTPWHTTYVSTVLQQRPSPESATENLRSHMCGIIHHDTFVNVAIQTTSFHGGDKCLKLMVIQQLHNRINSCIIINSVSTGVHSTFGEAPHQCHMSPGSQHKAFVVCSLGTETMVACLLQLACQETVNHNACAALNKSYSFAHHYINHTVGRTHSVQNT